MVKTSELVGQKVYVKKAGFKGEVKLAKLGKVHFAVFTPSGSRVVGLLVKRPDVVGMVARDDVFVALDAVKLSDEGLLVSREKAAFDQEARERLGLDWDRCIMWTGMDARTEDGADLGFVNDALFNMDTGSVSHFLLGDGSIAQSLVGSLEMPASMVRRYEKGYMIVDPAAAKLHLSGGAAAKAGEVTARARVKSAQTARKAGKAAGKAVDKGSYALGKQLGKTKGMFSSFMDEYKKAKS